MRALVVGIDGVRFDVVRAATTPVLDAVAAGGFLAPVRVDDEGPTISGPSWSTIATGVGPARHGVQDNSFTGHRLAAHPDFLTCLRTHDAGLRTLAAVTWAPLVDPTPGPVFRGPAVVAATGRGPAADDDRTVQHAAAALTGGAHAVFVHLDVCDEVAHALGTGAEYVAAVEASDRRLGLLLDAVADPAGTLVVVTTDHGHVDAGGHGGGSAAERTAWIAACGPGVPDAPPARLVQVDIHAQVLAAFGVEPAAGLRGRPFAR